MQLDGTRKVCTAKSGCLCIGGASHVSPAATHESFCSNFGERGVCASGLCVYFIPKILADVTLNF